MSWTTLVWYYIVHDLVNFLTKSNTIEIYLIYFNWHFTGQCYYQRAIFKSLYIVYILYMLVYIISLYLVVSNPQRVF